jgi:transcriptional regulator with XRE-family HTH domain
MTPADFRAWRARLRLSQEQAADALGVHRNTISLYERGTRTDRGRTPVVIPKVVALACREVERQMTEAGRERHAEHDPERHREWSCRAGPLVAGAGGTAGHSRLALRVDRQAGRSGWTHWC